MLLVAGPVCAVPPSLFWLADDLRAPDWLLTPYLVVTSAALPLLQVGTLGAATACWRAGRRGAGAALLGATVVVPMSATFSAYRLVLSDGVVVPVIVLVAFLSSEAAEAPADEPDLVGTYPPVMACLAVVAVLTLVAHRLWQGSAARTS